jgi:hypothetical protein
MTKSQIPTRSHPASARSSVIGYWGYVLDSTRYRIWYPGSRHSPGRPGPPFAAWRLVEAGSRFPRVGRHRTAASVPGTRSPAGAALRETLAALAGAVGRWSMTQGLGVGCVKYIALMEAPPGRTIKRGSAVKAGGGAPDSQRFPISVMRPGRCVMMGAAARRGQRCGHWPRGGEGTGSGRRPRGSCDR